MCKILKLITEPITYSNQYAKENNFKKVFLDTFIYIIFNTFAIMLLGIYIKLKIQNITTNFLNIPKVDVNFLHLFIISFIISAAVFLTMYVTFYAISKLMKYNKKCLDLFSFTVIMLIAAALGNTIASILLYIFPTAAFLTFYTTFIYYSISMITTTIKYFDVKEYDKFALLWTIVSLIIFSCAVIFSLIFAAQIYKYITYVF